MDKLENGVLNLLASDAIRYGKLNIDGPDSGLAPFRLVKALSEPTIIIRRAAEDRFSKKEVPNPYQLRTDTDYVRRALEFLKNKVLSSNIYTELAAINIRLQ